MKKLILAGAVAMFLLTSGAAYSHTKVKHPNLLAAHEMVVKAMKKLDEAQKDNQGKLEDHAQKAKDLLTQAESEISEAIKAADENEKAKK